MFACISSFSAYFYPLPPMDKGPLAKVNPVCSPLEEFCNQYAGGMMMHIQEQKVWVVQVIVFWLSEVYIHCEEWGSHLGVIPLTHLQPLAPSKMAKNKNRKSV